MLLSLWLPGDLLIALSVNLEPLLISNLFIGLAPGELGGICHFLAVKPKVDVALLIHASADLLGAYKGWEEAGGILRNTVSPRFLF